MLYHNVFKLQINKPLMERKRRARINESLNELKSLVLSGMKKDVSVIQFHNVQDEQIVVQLERKNRSVWSIGKPILGHFSNGGLRM